MRKPEQQVQQGNGRTVATGKTSVDVETGATTASTRNEKPATDRTTRTRNKKAIIQ
jgi:hypothetical protein